MARILRDNPEGNVNAKNSLERTPLHMAAIAGKAEALSCLLENNANTSAKDVYGLTPWHYASVLHGDNSRVTRVLNKAWHRKKTPRLRRERL